MTGLEAAQAALETYMKANLEALPGGAPAEELEAMQDLITDLMELATFKGMSPGVILERARGAFMVAMEEALPMDGSEQ